MEQTLAIGEDGYAVDVVGVAVVDLYTLPSHQPPSDTCVVAAREELSVADHCQPSDTVLMSWKERKPVVLLSLI